MRAGARWVSPTSAGATAAVPLTIFDRQVVRITTRRIFVFPGGLDVERLVETLPRALDAYALLAGRLRRGPRGPVLDPTPRGVRLVIADHEVATPRRLAPAAASRAIDRHVAGFGRAAPLVTVQINRMRDGGAILGFANNHGVLDGASCYQFLGHWAALARGDAEPPAPDHRRAELEALCERTPAVDPASLGLRPAGLRELAGMATYVLGARALLERIVLDIAGDELAALKARACAEQPADASTAISSNDALAADLWRRLEAIDGVARTIAVITNPRGTIGELAGPRYFGNFNDLALVQPPADASLGARAAALRAVVPTWSGARTLARGRVLQDLERERRRLAPAGVIDTVHGAPLINNWSRFPIFELDFGTGKPCWFDTPTIPLRRMAVITAHPEDPGGRLVHLTLPRRDHRAFAAGRSR